MDMTRQQVWSFTPRLPQAQVPQHHGRIVVLGLFQLHYLLVVVMIDVICKQFQSNQKSNKIERHQYYYKNTITTNTRIAKQNQQQRWLGRIVIGTFVLCCLCWCCCCDAIKVSSSINNIDHSSSTSSPSVTQYNNLLQDRSWGYHRKIQQKWTHYLLRKKFSTSSRLVEKKQQQYEHGKRKFQQRQKNNNNRPSIGTKFLFRKPTIEQVVSLYGTTNGNDDDDDNLFRATPTRSTIIGQKRNKYNEDDTDATDVTATTTTTHNIVLKKKCLQFNHNNPGMTNPTLNINNVVLNNRISNMKNKNNQRTVTSATMMYGIPMIDHHNRRSIGRATDGNHDNIDETTPIRLISNVGIANNNKIDRMLWWPKTALDIVGEEVVDDDEDNNDGDTTTTKTASTTTKARRSTLASSAPQHQQQWKVRRYRKRVGYGPNVYEACKHAALNWEFSSSNNMGMIAIPDENEYNEYCKQQQQRTENTTSVNTFATTSSNNGHSNRNIQQVWDGPTGNRRRFVTYTSSSSTSLAKKFLPQFITSFVLNNIYVLNPVQLIYDVIDQRAPYTTYTSTAYGTLRGHLLCGEERVTVCFRDSNVVVGDSIGRDNTNKQSRRRSGSRIGANSPVVYDNNNNHHNMNHNGPVDIEIVSYSRPSKDTILGRIVWPFIGSMQDQFFTQQLNSLENVAKKCLQQ